MRNAIFPVLFLIFLPAATLAESIRPISPEKVGVSKARLALVDAMMDRYIAEGKIPGMVTMIARDGRLVQQRAVGTLGVVRDDPMQMDSLFRIYSMTKAITAVAALMLYEEGHFQLYDPVSKYLPAFADPTVRVDGETRPAERVMTIHHLFTHMSGLGYGADYADVPGYEALKLGESESLDQFVERLAQLPLLYEPGTEWHYSFATDVLGAVVEKISGQALADFMRSRIFEPLDMKDTFFELPADKVSRLANNYAWNGEASEMVPVSVPPFKPGYRVASFDSGGGGLISTAPDYLRFLEMLRRGGSLGDARILGPKTVKFMMKDHLPRRISDANIGPGHDPTLGLGAGHGLGIGVYIDPIRRGVLSSPGENDWGGAAGTVYWIDPVENVVVVGMIQLFSRPFPFRDDLSVAFYQSLFDSYE